MTFSPAVRGPVHSEALIWFEAKSRETGQVETLGVWTGRENRSFSIGGVGRTYIGAGGVLNIGNIVSSVGVVVQTHSATLSILKPEIELAMRGYDMRFAPVEIHSARFDPVGNQLIALDRVLTGYLNNAPIRSGQRGGPGAITCSIVSSARSLTRTLPLVKSDAAQQLQEGDAFMQYAAVSGTTEVFWGMERQT
ncbi:MAG: hypothetical protein JXR13_15045 [Thalassovita sp.]